MSHTLVVLAFFTLAAPLSALQIGTQDQSSQHWKSIQEDFGETATDVEANFFVRMTMQLQMRVANTWMESDSLTGDHVYLKKQGRKTLKDLGINSGKTPLALLSKDHTDFEIHLASTANGKDLSVPMSLLKYEEHQLAKASKQLHQLERRRMVHDLWKQDVPADEFQKIVAGYAQVYRAEFASKSAVFFSHISKSAGTQLCMCGWDSGCKAWGSANQDDNCHARGPGSPMDIPAWGGVVIRPEMFDTCNQLETYNKANSFTVEGNENHLIRQGVCHQFWNVVIMRDPMDRLVSHLSHLHDLDEKMDRDWAQVQVGSFWDPENITAEAAFETIPIVMNNYYIRNLLGPKGYEIPFGKVNQTHLDEAKEILEQFDLVLIKDEELVSNIQRLMGWSCYSEASRSGHTEQYASNLKDNWSLDEWKRIEEVNQLDIELYRHAAMLYTMDLEVFDNPGFGSVLTASCPPWSTNATCGYLCK